MLGVAGPAQPSYEERRQAQIAKNREILRALDLGSTAKSAFAVAENAQTKTRVVKKAVKKAPKKVSKPVSENVSEIGDEETSVLRRSKRTRQRVGKKRDS